MTKPTVRTVDDLLVLAREATAEEAARQAKAAREQEARDLKSDRARAAGVVADRLSLETAPDAWERLDTDELGVRSRTVVYALGVVDGRELWLGYRQRGITDGGDVLVALAPDPDEGALVASRLEIHRLADLEPALDDAVVRADAWAHDRNVEEGDPAPAAPDRPAATLSGRNVEEILAQAIAIIAHRDLP